MKVVIIEDEKSVSDKLIELINKEDETIQIASVSNNLDEPMTWLDNQTVDLIFLKRHLVDKYRLVNFGNKAWDVINKYDQIIISCNYNYPTIE